MFSIKLAPVSLINLRFITCSIVGRWSEMVVVKLPDIMSGTMLENILSISIRMANYSGWL